MLLATLFVATGYAQSLKDVRINEVLVKNTNNFVDGYGQRSSWIELFNTGHARLKLAGCYLVATKYDGTKIEYQIPVSDADAMIAPLGYVLFHCTGNPHHGTFYTNFTLDDVKSVAFLNASKDVEAIDNIAIDTTGLKENMSIGYLSKEDDPEVKFTILPYTTPLYTNDAPDSKPKYQKFVDMDPSGAVMTVTAISVVFGVLLSLFILFKLLGVYMVKLARRNDAASKKSKDSSVAKVGTSFSTPYNSEEIAAIAMAMKLYSEDLHDKESAILTINRVARAYSPWSSKIYGLRQTPRN